MRILAVERALPARVMSNEDIIEMIRCRSAICASSDQWAAVEERLRRYWAATGTKRRHVLAETEIGFDLAITAAERALASAGVGRDDVDLVIYVGVGRGVLEPAMASLVQNRLGFPSASCFDVLEACQSWLRGLQVARSMLHSGDARVALIVNCEVGFEGLCDFSVADVDDVDRIIGATTIGEVATATIVAADGSADDFYFRFRNLGEHFDACMIPLPGYDRFVGPMPGPQARPGQFHVDTAELMRVMAIEVVREFQADAFLTEGEYDIVFFHQASERIADYIRRRLGIPAEICVHTHSEYGNTVSAAVPLSMSVALEEGRWQRGQRSLVVTGAAGVSIGFARFTF